MNPLRVPAAVVAVTLVAIVGGVLAAGWLLTDWANSRPSVSQTQASAIAVQWVSSPPAACCGATPTGAPISGWTVNYERYVASTATVTASSGTLVHTDSRRCPAWLSFCAPPPAWYVELSAPGQGGWKYYDGYVLVDARSGQVLGASVTGHN